MGDSLGSGAALRCIAQPERNRHAKGCACQGGLEFPCIFKLSCFRAVCVARAGLYFLWNRELPCLKLIWVLLRALPRVLPGPCRDHAWGIARASDFPRLGIAVLFVFENAIAGACLHLCMLSDSQSLQLCDVARGALKLHASRRGLDSFPSIDFARRDIRQQSP